MQKLKKLIAVLTVFVLVASVFTMLAMPTEGGIAEENEDDFVRLENIIDPDTGAPIAELPALYVGQQGIQFALRVRALEQDANDNVTQVSVEVDPDEELPGTWVNRIEEPGPGGEGANMTAGENNTYDFGYESDSWYDPEPFEFNVDGNAQPGTYQMDVRIYYSHANETGVVQDTHFDTYIEFEIEQNVEVSDPDQLSIGEDFQEMAIEIENVGDATLSDITLTLVEDDLPNGVEFSRDGGHTATYEGGAELDPDESGFIYYRVDVASDADFGTHTINYELFADKHYEEDEIVEIEEYGDVDLDVGVAPIIEAEISDVEHRPAGVTFNVTFHNTGNVDLYDVEVTLLTDDEFFLDSVDHYEYGEGVTEPEIYIGDLSEGDETDEMEFEIGLDRYLQDGNHRLLFDWDGYFYHENHDRFYEVGVEWEDWDDGDPDTTTAILSWGEVEEEDWIGPEIFFEIDRDYFFFSGKVTNPDPIELAGDITNVDIEVEITNHELVAFRDVETQLLVGEDTPFFNPVDQDRNYVEMDVDESDQELPADDTADFTFTVDINTDDVSKRIGNGSHAYEATVMITQAVNDDTNEELTDISVGANVGLRGYGPNLVVEAELSDHDLEAGENFTLEYTIKNEGDEAARETTVSMIPDLYDNDWEIIDGFIRALASSKEKYEFGEVEERERSKNTSHLEIDLLGLEDGEDIVDLHMYIEGALSSPRPHIWNIYKGEILPGEEVTVSFEMVASEHTQIGQPYQENIHIEWMDANGEMQEREYPTTISLAEAPEEPDEPAEVFGIDAAVFGVILVIIILVIVLAVSLGSRKTGRKEEEEETFEELEEETEIEEEVEEPIEEDELFEEPEEPDELEEPLEEEPSDMDEDEEEW